MTAEVETIRDEQDPLNEECPGCLAPPGEPCDPFGTCETEQAESDAKLDAMLRRDWLILEAHGSLCGCSSCSWKKILDDMTKGDADGR